MQEHWRSEQLKIRRKKISSKNWTKEFDLSIYRKLIGIFKKFSQNFLVNFFSFPFRILSIYQISNHSASHFTSTLFAIVLQAFSLSKWGHKVSSHFWFEMMVTQGHKMKKGFRLQENQISARVARPSSWGSGSRVHGWSNSRSLDILIAGRLILDGKNDPEESIITFLTRQLVYFNIFSRTHNIVPRAAAVLGSQTPLITYKPANRCWW